MALLMLVGPKCCRDIVRIESFTVNVMRGKFWCMLLWLCLILGKYLAANVKKGYSQVGNELLHGAGSSWIVYYKRHRRIYQLVFSIFLLYF